MEALENLLLFTTKELANVDGDAGDKEEIEIYAGPPMFTRRIGDTCALDSVENDCSLDRLECRSRILMLECLDIDFVLL